MSKDLDVSMLKEKGWHRNYICLCEKLNEPVLKGNSKKAQLKNWARYFEWSMSGRKYVIKKIYKKPKPYIENRGRHNSSRKGIKNTKIKQGKYNVYLGSIMSEVLHTSEVNLFSKSYLIRSLELSTSMFENIKYTYTLNEKKAKLCKALNVKEINDETFNFCYETFIKKTNSILMSLVKSLENASFISCEQATVKRDVLNKYVYIKVSSQEEELVKSVEKEVLRDMKCKNMYEVYSRKKNKAFFSERNRRLEFVTGEDWDCCYYLEINLLKEIPNEKKLTLSECKEELHKIMLDYFYKRLKKLEADKVETVLDSSVLIDVDVAKKIFECFLSEGEEE